MKHVITSSFFLFFFVSIYGQNFSDETIKFSISQPPKVSIDDVNKTYDVHVSSPYNLTADAIFEQSKIDHQDKLDNYDKLVKQSEVDYQYALRNLPEEEKKAREKYKLEEESFKSLSVFERLALIDQGQRPKLVLPEKPVYYKPDLPFYTEPNLKDYIIIDDNVLASKILINQFKRGKGYVIVDLSIAKVDFQDNAGQTYAKQPTRLQLKENGSVKVDEIFFNDFQFVAPAPTNVINKVQEEQRHLEGVIKFINNYLSDRYEYQAKERIVKLGKIKNNKNIYDDIEKGHIYITTNLKKLSADQNRNSEAFKAMDNGVELWNKALQKVDFQNPKADYNAKVAKNLYLNFIRLYLSLNNKKVAENYLNKMQEHLVEIELSSSEKRELNLLEKEVYEAI